MSLVLETSKYFFARSCRSFLLYSRTTCNVEVKSRIIAYCTDQFSSVKSCFLKWLTSSRGRKTHNQHRDILLCMFNFVNSGLNCFTWLYKGMPGVRCLESFGFLCSLTGYVACELVCLCISNTRWQNARVPPDGDADTLCSVWSRNFGRLAWWLLSNAQRNSIGFK